MADELPPLWLACHECGHAILHLVLRDRREAAGLAAETYLVHVTLFPATQTGRVKHGLRNGHDGRDHAARCLAGFCAENVCRYGLDWRPAADAFEASAHLADIARAAAEVAGFADPPAELRRAWEVAHGIITAEWPALLAVAEVLRKRLTLSAEGFEAGWRAARDLLAEPGVQA